MKKWKNERNNEGKNKEEIRNVQKNKGGKSEWIKEWRVEGINKRMTEWRNECSNEVRNNWIKESNRERGV